MKRKILFTGGNGNFGKVFRKINHDKKIIYPSSKKFDVTNLRKMDNFLKKERPDYLIHCAALARPMKLHEEKINKSIDVNIIGTCNVVKLCKKYKIKLVYFSTNYIYPSKNGKYNEKSPILPFNNYGWSKLGGEAAVHMYKNSLILRVCMTKKPFTHNKAFSNLITNFIFQDEVAEKLLKFIDKKGVINVGGKPQSVYKFAKKYNKSIKKTLLKKNSRLNLPKNSTMVVKKFYKFYK